MIEYQKKVATCDELCIVANSLMPTLEKYLRRDSSEASLACISVGLFAIIVGEETDYDVTKTILILNELIKDKACSYRASAAQALAIISHFTLESQMHLEESVRILFDAWSTFKTDSPLNVDFSAILQAWLLLVNDASSSTQLNAFDSGVAKLTKFLDSSNVELRISAGEGLAFLYQLGKEDDEDFQFYNHHHLKRLFEEMINESSKSHAKKDKRSQRFSIRQVMDIIFDDDYPTTSIKYTNREKLDITSCYERLIYELLCIFLKVCAFIHYFK